jgi:hypothetical protein
VSDGQPFTGGVSGTLMASIASSEVYEGSAWETLRARQSFCGAH